MFTPLERMMAGRYLRARKAEGFVSVIAAFSFLGIMLGVAALIIVMSVMNGFRAELVTRMLGLNGHLSVYAQDAPLLDYTALAARVRAVPGVKTAAPMIEGQALLTLNGSATGVMIRGFDPAEFAKKPIISTSIIDGRIEDFTGMRAAIGVKLADRFGLKVGDSFTLLSPQGRAGPFGTIPRMQTFRVGLIFDVGMYEFNSGFIYVPLPAAQAFFNMRNTVNSIEVMTDNPARIAEIKPLIITAVAGEAGVYDWQETNKTFLGVLKTESNVMFLILGLVNVIAGFNIISSMIMLVKEKTRQIAILRTMGMTKISVLKIFLLVGSSIGVAGTLMGVLIGVSFAMNIESIRHVLEGMTGSNLFPDEIYFFSQMPAEVHVGDVIKAVILSLSLSLFFTFLPAWRAAKLNPVEAIRYE